MSWSSNFLVHQQLNMFDQSYLLIPVPHEQSSPYVKEGTGLQCSWQPGNTAVQNPSVKYRCCRLLAIPPVMVLGCIWSEVNSPDLKSSVFVCTTRREMGEGQFCHKVLIQMQRCGRKPRLEVGRRAKYLTQANGWGDLWSWLVLAGIGGF